jgi:Na+/H+ antiporter NhaD/arsenite permease-like protein
MTGGAVISLLSGAIDPYSAAQAINAEVMLFLFAMFVIGQAAIQSGLLICVSHRFCTLAATADQRIGYIIIFAACSSAVFMNDTIAIIGTPLVLAIAERSGLSPKVALLALCFSITTGSVMSPIGNPQNFLIMVYSGMESPFTNFFCVLLIPTLISLLLIIPIIKLFSRFEDSGEYIPPVKAPEKRDLPLCRITIFALLIFAGVLMFRTIGELFSVHFLAEIPLVAGPVLAALVILLFSSERTVVFRNIDWCTLLFFASMFVLMESVYMTGWFQQFIPETLSIPGVLAISIIISQFISNVPFVALFEPSIGMGMNSPLILSLAAGSTLAGNFSILGAASNVIVLEQAEIRGVTISLREFCRIGVPLTIVQGIVYAFFLSYAY